MAGYNEIRGLRVKYLSDDPSNAENGQVWYNSTSGNLRVQGMGIESTTSASSMINKKSLYGWGVGTGTAGLTVGGVDDTTYLSVVEEYNGSGWAAGGTYPTARYSAGTAGTQTAAMAYCGRVPGSPGGPTETFEYNGSSWTSGNSFPTPGNSMQGIGAVDTAVVSTEVYTSTNMHHWNGTSWTSANARNTAKGGQAAFGTQTAAVLAGGFPNESTQTELYDGTNWTTSSNMVTGANQIAGAGTQTDGVSFGGDRPPTEAAQTTIQTWNGSSWSTSPATLATARTRAGTGRNTAAGTWVAGGIGPGGGGEGFNATEQFNSSANTITAAAWSSATAMPEKNYGAGSFGTKTAFVYFGGAPYPSKTNATREYNGSSWSTTGNYIGSFHYLSGCGVETAGLGAAGSPPTQTSSAEYDGSSWTSGNSMSQQRQNTGSTMVGTQPAALIVGGDQFPSTPRSLTACEEYDGTNWSTGGVWPTPVQNTAAAGTQTAGWAAGGLKDSSPGSPNVTQDATNEYDGSSWTASGAIPTATQRAGAAGPQTAGLFFAGFSTANALTSFSYDGAVWSTNPSMATARQSIGAGGVSSPSTAAIGAGGYITPNTTTAVEEFTGETSTAAAQTITVS